MKLEFMTMEEVFIVTYSVILLISFLFGIFAYWIFEKDNKKNNNRENE